MSRIDFVTGAPEKYMSLVRDLTQVAERLEPLVASYTSRDLQRAPSEDAWGASRVMAHMISYAVHNGEFINQIIWMTDPRRRAWDEDGEVSSEGWTNKNGAALLEALREPLNETIELLSGTPDASWGRPGTVPGRGRRSLRQQVRAHIDHLNEHIDQVEELLAVPEAAGAAS
jgi:DinB superfamily